MIENGLVLVGKVKYLLRAADWQRCLTFYQALFGGEISLAMNVRSGIVNADSSIGVHGGGEGKRNSQTNEAVADCSHLAMSERSEANEFMMTMKRN